MEKISAAEFRATSFQHASAAYAEACALAALLFLVPELARLQLEWIYLLMLHLHLPAL